MEGGFLLLFDCDIVAVVQHIDEEESTVTKELEIKAVDSLTSTEIIMKLNYEEVKELQLLLSQFSSNLQKK